jgi:hypothetical protein
MLTKHYAMKALLKKNIKAAWLNFLYLIGKRIIGSLQKISRLIAGLDPELFFIYKTILFYNTAVIPLLPV